MNLKITPWYEQTSVDPNVGAENLGKNLKDLVDAVQKYINIGLGTLMGLVGLAIIIIGGITLFKASTSESEEVRQANLRKIKWLFFFVLGIAILWGVSSLIIRIVTGSISTTK
ncbi:hypothetical protein NPA07_03245 [Mycoplasmopsis caviae]|uniref:Transmembrane protein n=1 Tax=Mycoplasmopsis caviae TaxID=55603 RepID=A0A3P8L7T0_9BACT|nr:hypothetical protein [Mycoplasmopsis caviae]UUD34812.1 hypothetical protein NPA07_03245 [Mycoplasmopsis caviae]VDR42335.1 Uncharacterised protein [Mycoplasmopsis caviae]